MEWVILLPLVSLIVLAVLIVLGFTGCGFSANTGLSAPENLTVVAVGRTTVTLSWMNPNLLSVTFEIERTREGDTVPAQIPVSSFPSDAVEVVDTNLEPDTNYLYQVRAVRSEDDLTSSASNSVFAQTLP